MSSELVFSVVHAHALTGSRRIGSGTGIFTRALLANPDWSSSVGELKALEPSEGMRDVFAKAIKDERVTTDEGSFEHTSVQDGWADLVVIAQVCRGWQY